MGQTVGLQEKDGDNLGGLKHSVMEALRKL